METINNFCGPCIKSINRKFNETIISFDLSNCSQSEVSDFIFNVITTHHVHDVGIDVDMKSNKQANVHVSWLYGKELFAEKVINKIQKLSVTL